MVKYLLALTILLSGCASVPRFSSEPQDCDPKTWGDEYPHDLVNYAKAVGLSLIHISEPTRRS